MHSHDHCPVFSIMREMASRVQACQMMLLSNEMSGLSCMCVRATTWRCQGLCVFLRLQHLAVWDLQRDVTHQTCVHLACMHMSKWCALQSFTRTHISRTHCYITLLFQLLHLQITSCTGNVASKPVRTLVELETSVFVFNAMGCILCLETQFCLMSSTDL